MDLKKMVDERRGRQAALPSTATIVAKHAQFTIGQQAIVTRRSGAYGWIAHEAAEPTGSVTGTGFMTHRLRLKR
ncbi:MULTISPECIES: hypothetical protein [unclassified Bradyrhizobium]